MIKYIIKPGFKDLNFLILKIGLIFKTMVFIYNIGKAIALIAYLESLLPPELRKQRNILI